MHSAGLAVVDWLFTEVVRWRRAGRDGVVRAGDSNEFDDTIRPGTVVGEAGQQ